MLFVLLALSTNSFSDDKEDYIRARQIKDINNRIQAYEDYLLKYRDSEYHKYVYVLLTGDYFTIDKRSKAFEYAEKAEKFISQLGLSEAEMVGLYIVLGNNYSSKQNKDKALAYADKAIQIAGTKQGETWKDLLASAQDIKNKAGTAPVAVSPTQKAAALYKSGKTDEALRIFKEQYKLKKDGAIAYNIGIIVAQKTKTEKNLVAEAVNYLLEASILSPAKSKKAMELAESLFFSHCIDKDTGLNYNGLIQRAETMKKALKKKTDDFNTKYSDKKEDDVDKKQMESDQKALSDLGKNIGQLEGKIRKAVEDFNKILEQARGRVS